MLKNYNYLTIYRRSADCFI